MHSRIATAADATSVNQHQALDPLRHLRVTLAGQIVGAKLVGKHLHRGATKMATATASFRSCSVFGSIASPAVNLKPRKSRLKAGFFISPE